MAMSSFKDWPLKWKLAVPAGALTLVVAAGLGYLVHHTQRELVLEQASKTAHAVAMQIEADRAVYTDAVVGKMAAEGVPAITENLEAYRKLKGAIPLPASFVHATSSIVNDKGFHTADLLSLWNLNPEKGPRDVKEKEALQALVRDPRTVRSWVADEGMPSVRFVQVIADVASSRSCVDCHNAHPRSSKRDFKLNDVMGGLVISVPLREAFEASRQVTWMWTGVLVGLALLIILVIAAVQWRYISKPLISLEKAAEQVSLGNVDLTIAIESKDEVGRLAAAFDRMRRGTKKAMERLAKRPTDN